MERKVKNLTAKQERAALMLGSGASTSEVAVDLEVTPRCVQKWIKLPEFAKKVAENAAFFRRKLKETSIADVDYRVGVLDKLLKKYITVIDARAETYTDNAAPGAGTGVLSRVVNVTTGRDGVERVTTEYRTDTAIADVVVKVVEQAGKQLGQIGNKLELTGHGGGAIRIMDEPDLAGLSDEEIDLLEKLLVKGASVDAAVEED